MAETMWEIKSRLSASDHKKILFIGTFFRNKYLIPIYFLICIAGGGLAVIREEGPFLSKFIVNSLALIIITTLAVFIQLLVVNKLRLKKSGLEEMKMESFFIFNEDKFGVRTSIQKVRKFFKYTGIYEILESRSYIFVYVNKKDFYILATRDVNNLKELSNFLRRKTEGKYRKIIV